jgi:aspartate dehydrogenase
MRKRRIGILGYGKLGQHLVSSLLNDSDVRRENELVFVWNRKVERLHGSVPAALILEEIGDYRSHSPDLVVEVAHPKITNEWGTVFLESCDYFSGSPTAFADLSVETAMRRAAANSHGFGLYIPRGALPGMEDVLQLQRSGKLSSASIVMRKHPSSLKFSGVLSPPLSDTKEERVVYSGPLRELCGLAPNNVNTMAVLALSSELGFDRLHASLIADPSLNHHITEVGLYGPGTKEERFSLELQRRSPAGAGAVTSTATLTTFLISILKARGMGAGVHFV